MSRVLFINVVLYTLLMILFTGADAHAGVEFESPLPGAEVRAGSSISVAVRASEDIQVVFVGIVGDGGQLTLEQRPFVGNIRVPKHLRGEQQLVVLGYSSGQAFEKKIALKIKDAVGGSAEDLRSRYKMMSVAFPGDSVSPSFYLENTERRTFDLSLTDLKIQTSDNLAILNGEVVALSHGDGWIAASFGDKSILVPVFVPLLRRGDLNGDEVVDESDIYVFRSRPLNVPAKSSSDARDLNGDGKIDALDLRVLTTLCTRPRCATQ